MFWVGVYWDRLINDFISFQLLANLGGAAEEALCV